jgi:hypothetical protein
MLASKLTFSIKISYLLVSRKEWRENKELPKVESGSTREGFGTSPQRDGCMVVIINACLLLSYPSLVISKNSKIHP